MVATLQLVEYAHLHIQPIQWYLKQRWTVATHGLQHPMFVNKDIVQMLSWWLVLCLPTPLSLWMRAWRDGAATVSCRGLVLRFTAVSG